MNNHKSLLFLITGIFFLAFMGCYNVFNTPCNDKTITTEERTVETFDGIDLNVPANVKVLQGTPLKCKLEGASCDLEKVETVLKGSTLVIRAKQGSWNIGKITVYLTMEEVKKLSIAGSGDILSENPISTTDLKLDIAGSGSIKIELAKVETINSSIAGSGSIGIAGNAQMNNHDIDIAGSGDVNAKELAASTVKVDIAGSGSCYLYVTEKLEASIAGSGDVYYKGKPSVNASISGSGKVKAIE